MMMNTSLTRATLALGNVHCPSCVTHLESILTSSPMCLEHTSISISILTGLVSFSYPSNDSRLLEQIKTSIQEAGFEILDEEEEGAGVGPSKRTLGGGSPAQPSKKGWFSSKRSQEKKELEEAELARKREETHRASCKACRDEVEGLSTATQLKGKTPECILQLDSESDTEERISTFIVTGMTCSSCTSSVQSILSSASDERILETKVTLIPGGAVVRHKTDLKVGEIAEMLEDGGYGAEWVESKDVERAVRDKNGWTETRLIIDGMTCSSCIGSLSSIISPTSLNGVRSAQVTLLPPLAIVIHDSRILTKEKLIEELEDGGYGAVVVSSAVLEEMEENLSGRKSGERQVKLRVDGMFCDNCSSAINAHLEALQRSSLIISYTPLSIAHPVTTLVYIPSPPDGFTLRLLRSSLADLGPFTIHPLTLSSTLSLLAAKSQLKEARKVSLYLLATFIAAIPTFIIGVVFMSLVSPTHYLARYFAQPIWGSATRGTIALFILATPVQFGAGSLFYSRAWKGLKGVWKRTRGKKGGWKERLWRWGSMDTLVALGTTAAWSASVAFMVLDITAPPSPMHPGGSESMSYFDSSVFLILFILAGRWLEGISRRRTSEEVEKLGKLKPAFGILYSEANRGRISTTMEGEQEEMDAKDINSLRTISIVPTISRIQSISAPTSTYSNRIEVDFLELGDVLLIPSGSSVPLDCILLPQSSSSNFDESSLTGESVPIFKSPSDTIYAGSTNLGPSACIVQVITGPGQTMIDGIVASVRDAMSRKASIETLADQITGIFVPAIVGIACLTFGIWIIRGYLGNLPEDWLPEGGRGGWVLFAVQFAVAVLVVACPCGIGLSAPTAQMVGTGIAARLGIVPYGGGEAFQNATKIDVVVFDKTGTITRGEFKVTDHRTLTSSVPSLSNSPSSLFRILDAIEETSAHPISVGLRAFCTTQASPQDAEVRLLNAKELPGRGLSALVSSGESQLEVLVGNELLMLDEEAECGIDNVDRPDITDLLQTWGSSGNSVVIVALREVTNEDSNNPYRIIAMFAIQDPPRTEASYVIKELESQGIAVYLCTGDNRNTALAIARSVGINEDQIFAGVLPIGKRDCIEMLQKGGATDVLVKLRARGNWWNRLTGKKIDARRARVCFVGDGINDIVALTQSDVGVSMGTGASVALSSSDFCLLSSNLLSLLTVLSLAKATYYKIWTNFAWASCFNTILIPVAAGAFYDLGKTRLPPVWASLAMALSSVSVVTNSLLLRWTFRPPKAVRNYGLAAASTK